MTEYVIFENSLPWCSWATISAIQHAEGSVREKAPKDFSQACLVLDLIAIAEDDRHRHHHRI
jgi:hypothetical protein